MTDLRYYSDQELPALAVEWRDRDDTVIDFSSGWTFTAKVCATATPNTVALSKTTGITGASTSPNVTIDFATTDFSGLTASTAGTRYVVRLYARRTADSKDRVFGGDLSFLLLTAPT